MNEENVQEDEPIEEPSQEVEEQVETEPTEAPAQEEEVDEEVDDYVAPQAPVPPGLDEIPRDKDGNYDAQGFAEWVQKQTQSAAEQARIQTQAELRQYQKEQAAWEKIYKEWPQAKEDKQLQNQIHNARIGDLYRGGKGDLVKAARGLKKLVGDAKSEGKRAQQEHVRVQESAHVETASNRGDSSGSRESELINKISSRNRLEADAATQELLKQWRESGKL